MIGAIIHKLYGKGYKRMIFLPLTLLVIAIIIIIGHYLMTGIFVDKAVSLKGGYTISVATQSLVDINALEKLTKERFPQNEIGIIRLMSGGSQKGIILEADFDNDQSVNSLVELLSQNIQDYHKEDVSIEKIGSSLGQSFFFEAILTIIIAFFFMAIVVFIYFKTFVPSITVVSCAAIDIIETFAIFNLLGLKLSSAGIAAFIMLIGYSVDTDILLTARLIKRTEGTINDRIAGAASTGLTMTLTAIGVVVVSLLITNSAVIHQIMTIVLIGLIFDIFNTWITNAIILKWHLEHKGQH